MGTSSSPPCADASPKEPYADHPLEHRDPEGPGRLVHRRRLHRRRRGTRRESTFAAALVHFTPGARTAWHTHPHGQTIFVTEGVGLCQREGGPVEVLRPGDRVFFEPGENHWHGAAPDRFMAHIAIHQNDETGSPVSWGRHVTDEEYSAAPHRAN